MPKNTSLGLFIGLGALCLGFGLVWHMYWLAILSILWVIVCIVHRARDEHTEYVILARKVEREEINRIYFHV